jgi:hypothetical protein
MLWLRALMLWTHRESAPARRHQRSTLPPGRARNVRPTVDRKGARRELDPAVGGLTARAGPIQCVLNGYAEFAAENRSEGMRLSA